MIMAFQKLCQRPAANTAEGSFELSATFKCAVPPYDDGRWVVSHLVRGKKRGLLLSAYVHSREAQAALVSSVLNDLSIAPRQCYIASQKQACGHSDVFTIPSAKFCHNQSSVNPKDCLVSQKLSFHLRWHK